MSCGVTNRELALFEDGLLNDIETAEMRGHAQSCPECLERLSKLRALHTALENAGRRTRAREAVLARLREAGEKAGRPSRALRIPTLQWRFAPAMACLFAALLIGRAWIVQPAAPPVSLLARAGTVTVSGAAGGAGGAELRLGGDGFAAVRMGDGLSLAEFGPNTVAAITGDRSLRLERGAVWNEVAPNPDAPYVIETPHGTVTVLGTRFEVEATETAATVRVAEGRVAARPGGESAGSGVEVGAGEFGVLSAEGVSRPAPAKRSEIAPWRAAFLNGGEIRTSDMARQLRRSAQP